MLLHYARAGFGKQSVTRPGFIRLSAAAFSTLLGIGSSILVARTLGPGAFGIYTGALWLATVAIPVIGVGMSNATSRHMIEIQQHHDSRMAAGLFRFVWRRQSRSMLVYCGVYVLLALPLSWWFGANAPMFVVLLAGLCALPLLLSGVVGVTLRGLQRFDLLATIHLFSAVAGLFLITLAAQVAVVPGERSEQIGLFLLASALATTLSLAVGVISVMRLLPVRDATQPHVLVVDRLTRGLSNSVPLFLLDGIVWQRSEVLLLGHWQSTAQLGFYSLSAIISTHMMEFSPMALSTCILPLVVRTFPRWRYASAADAFVKTSLYVTLLAVPLCILTIVFCPTIVVFCFGAAYLPVVAPLRLLTVSATIGSIATVSLTHLANGERRKVQIRLGVVAAILNVILAVPLIVLWGITGAALASMIAQLVSALGSILICRKLIFPGWLPFWSPPRKQDS
jgi:O-antigen/teichoic acid export membrane protein